MHTHIHTDEHMHTYTHILRNTHTDTHRHTHTQTHAHTRIHICDTHIHTDTHTCTHTHTSHMHTTYIHIRNIHTHAAQRHTCSRMRDCGSTAMVAPQVVRSLSAHEHGMLAIANAMLSSRSEYSFFVFLYVCCVSCMFFCALYGLSCVLRTRAVFESCLADTALLLTQLLRIRSEVIMHWCCATCASLATCALWCWSYAWQFSKLCRYRSCAALGVVTLF